MSKVDEYQKKLQGNCRHGEIEGALKEIGQSLNRFEFIGIVAMCKELLQDFSEASIKGLLSEIVKEAQTEKEVI